MPQFKSGSHTLHRLKYHITWIPKYRRRVLKGEIAMRLENLLRQCAEVNGWQIEELSVQPDHIHLLVQLPPTMTVAYAVQLFKGGSSKVIRTEFPDLEEFLWGDSFWADGYFAETIGRQSETWVKRYIRNQ